MAALLHWSVPPRQITGLLLTLVATCLPAASGWAQNSSTPTAASVPVVDDDLAPTIGLDEIERGQTGYGVSVFAGTETERFDVEVVGVLRNMNPGTSFILAHLRGQGLEESGVIGGMSGSPVYIDGRLAGAVAFSWSFAKGALAGITPIATMRELWREPAASGGAAPGGTEEASSSLRLLESGPGTWRLDEESQQQLLERGADGEDLREWVARFLPSPREDLQGVPSHTLSLSGFSGEAEALLRSQWRGNAAPAGRADEALDLPELGAGSSVCGILVGGDLTMAVSGTVTDRQGDRLLAFGHPFLGIGELDIPMAQAEVVAVVSSTASSFKLTNIGPAVGRFEQDRLPGIVGRLGDVPEMTPITLTIGGDHRARYELQLADLPAMRPGLLGTSILQTFEAGARSAGEQSVDMRARFDLGDHGELVLEQTYDGTGAAFDAAIFLLQVSGFLELNPYVDVDIDEIVVDFEVWDRRRQVALEDARPARRVVRPGELLPVHLELRDVRGDLRRETIEVAVPADAPSGSYYFFLGDGPAVDAVKLRIGPREPRDFAETVELLGSYRSSRDLVILGTHAGRGLVTEGRLLPELPASVRALWGSARRNEVRQTTLVLDQETVQRRARPLDGIARIDLTVERDAP